MPAYKPVHPYDPARGRPVHEAIAGEYPVTMDTLERVLGKSSAALWRAMVLCRSESGGVYHGTTQRLAARVELSERNVKRCLARLRAAKLVRDDGWRKLRVFRGGRVVETTVYARTVYGAITDAEATAAVVPTDVAEWIASAPGHGGDRRSQDAQTPTKPAPVRGGTHLKPIKCVPSTPAQNVQPCSTARGPHAPSEAVRSVQEDFKCVPPPGSDFSSVSLDREGIEERGTLPSLASPRMPAAKVGREPSSLFVVEHSNNTGPVREHSGDARRLGRARDVTPPIAVGGPIPPYPGASLISPAVLPHPPMVDASASDEDKAMLLVRAYNGACESRYKKRSRVLSGYRALRGSKHFANLVRTANFLVEKKISPHEWAAWYLDSRIKFGREDKPPISVVFGRNTVGDHVKRAIFRRDRKRMGGRIVYGPKHLDLVSRYEAMRQDIRQLPITTEDELRVVVAEHFPPGVWGLLLSDAQKEAADLQVQFTTAVQAGQFIW